MTILILGKDLDWKQEDLDGKPEDLDCKLEGSG